MDKQLPMRIRLPALLFIFFLPGIITSQQTVGLFLNTPSAQDGYILFSNSKKTYLIDNCGYTINIWESEYQPGLSVYLLDNGDLLRPARSTGGFSGGGFELFNWDGNLIWSYEFSDNDLQPHHDIEPLPNGHFLAITWERCEQVEAQLNGRKYDGGVWSERIVEIEIVGNGQANIVWEWRLWDHLVQDYDNGKLNYGNIAEHPELVDINYIGDQAGNEEDWVHLNAIAYNPALDQIAVSSRNFSEIWIIDHSTSTAEAAAHSGGNAGMGGDILYRFGNPLAYQRGTSSDRFFFHQHDVRWLKDGQQLSVFNNQVEHEKSAVQIWTPPINSDGTYPIESGVPFGPDMFDWEYSADGFYSKFMSGAQHLPNGNILICEGDDGHLFEVTKEKEVVWKYVNPVSSYGFSFPQGGTPLNNDLFRGTKYGVDHPAFIGKNLIQGSALEASPWDSDCEIYLTGTNDKNNPLIGKISIYGNPVRDVFKINSTYDLGELFIGLFDLRGNNIFQKEIAFGINEITMQLVPSGIYLLVIRNEKGYLFSKKISVIK